MTHPNPSTALARVVIDELANQGVRLVVISPGSRSGALAIAASQHPDLETRVVIDERSAAFHALGDARATGRPSAAVSTSGSAPASFFPSVVEADMSCVPLVVITADRPAEMQGRGANQTIDQVDLFGSKVRAFTGIEAPGSKSDRNHEWRLAVANVVSSAVGDRPGPVHFNVRFREPTVPVTDDGRTTGEEYPFETPRIEVGGVEADGETPHHLPRLDPTRGLVIAGDGEYDRDQLTALASEIGWPVLATALSGMRGGSVISTYHHLLADGVPPQLVPETVVAVGSIGPSPRLETLVGTANNRIRIDRWGRTIDPDGTATHVLRGDVNRLLADIAGTASRGWSDGWLEAEERCSKRIDEILSDCEAVSGAGVVSSLNGVEWGCLVVASSLPIREVDAHLRRRGPIYGNRGASGIDGFVSTALGVAFRRPRALALSGDLSLLHDSNGFMHDGEIDLTMVVIDNHGGGLFDSLPQAAHAPEYERLFVTPPHRNLEDLARFHRLGYADAGDLPTLRELATEALDRPGVDIIRVEVDREYDLWVRAQLDR